LYGCEREGIPASKAFTGEYAEKTFLAVKKYLELIEKKSERRRGSKVESHMIYEK